jgi:L-seryl-tRNA(Ser) seleniumtransferase
LAKRAERLRQIPSVDELLAQPELRAWAKRLERGIVVGATRMVLEDVRTGITAGRGAPDLLNPPALAACIAGRLEEELAASLVPVVNATGVILHTNLGRAPLAPAVAEAIGRTVTQYSNLEYNLKTGARGKRDVHTARLLERLTGAQAAVVVNNNAAAVLLVLTALAKGGEVIVSRGELIEIGDSFRIPEIMAESGAFLHEVGTTNRTRVADYERAINGKTRLLLRVHPSNFRMTGFVQRPALEELVALGRRANLPMIEDLGSGCFVDLGALGLEEPMVRKSLEAGVSVITFSGDKLLGGPQAGIIAGQRALLERIRRHPLFRALRVDKLAIAALEVTLNAYLRGALEEIPVIRLMRLTAQEIGHRAGNLARALREVLPTDLRGESELEIVPGASLIGGGSTAAQELATRVIRVVSRRHSAAQLEERLRRAPLGTAVIARVEHDCLILDLRTVFPDQDALLRDSLAAVLQP